MTTLYIIRHGLAEERSDFAQKGLPDSERPLTPMGRKKVHRVGEALLSLEINLDALISSPYKRAIETAEIIGQSYPNAHLEEVEFLYPDSNPVESIQGLKGLVQQHTNFSQIAVLGHEPQLGALLSYLLTDQIFRCFPLKKASVTCIDFPVEFEAGKGQLKWSVPAKLFGRLS